MLDQANLVSMSALRSAHWNPKDPIKSSDEVASLSHTEMATL